MNHGRRSLLFVAAMCFAWACSGVAALSGTVIGEQGGAPLSAMDGWKVMDDGDATEGGRAFVLALPPDDGDDDGGDLTKPSEGALYSSILPNPLFPSLSSREREPWVPDEGGASLTLDLSRNLVRQAFGAPRPGASSVRGALPEVDLSEIGAGSNIVHRVVRDRTLFPGTSLVGAGIVSDTAAEEE